MSKDKKTVWRQTKVAFAKCGKQKKRKTLTKQNLVAAICSYNSEVRRLRGNHKVLFPLPLLPQL